jgi:hypothetical protein
VFDKHLNQTTQKRVFNGKPTSFCPVFDQKTIKSGTKTTPKTRFQCQTELFFDPFFDKNLNQNNTKTRFQWQTDLFLTCF